MDDRRLAQLVDEVGVLARRAGEAILATRLGAGDVAAKADGSPVTQADLASERVILAGLTAIEPRLPIVSEEGDVERALASAGRLFWLVDPLDGTKEFVKGLPEYTVNIALVEDGQPILGAIHVPPIDCLYIAARGLGARRIEAGGTTTPLRPSAVARPKRAVTSRSHLSPETESFLKRLGITETSPRGSSLKICAVAEGQADVYPRLGPIRLWDTAAGAAIAREAGCAVLDLSGAPLNYDPARGLTHTGLVVCAPGACLDLCLRALAATP
jgi:3'(2'), 5'-bisphosphate nucleotidase